MTCYFQYQSLINFLVKLLFCVSTHFHCFIFLLHEMYMYRYFLSILCDELHEFYFSLGWLFFPCAGLICPEFIIITVLKSVVKFHMK